MTDTDENIQYWKIKKLIRSLKEARGNGTSMISLVIPPKDVISRVNRMLAEEYGTASNIKSRVNRLSVLGAITSAQARLKLYNRVPPNGLVVYVGTVLLEDNKEKKVSIDFEPFKPINTSLYLCDNKFHTEPLEELLQSNDVFGFIILDGQSCLFATLCGNTRNVLHKIAVDLPKKHGRGGQSAARFARLRLEKRHTYLSKVSELCTQLFISNDKPNVKGLVLAGLAEFKNELATNGMLDSRLQPLILKICDISYGGENGFNQAIEQSQDALGNVKFIAETKLLNKYFEQIAQDTGKVCYGIKDTMFALTDATAAETLIVYEDLQIPRNIYRTPSGEEIISFTYDPNLELLESQPLVDWLSTEYKKFGAQLEFVSDRSQEGSQFVKGFGGIGAILRFAVNFDIEPQMSDESDDLTDYF
jgi:peptide chain release factor subunit 1